MSDWPALLILALLVTAACGMKEAPAIPPVPKVCEHEPHRCPEDR
jgi:hypothetical protein